MRDSFEEMFDVLRGEIVFKGEEDWAAFKKWVIANEKSFNPWYFTRNGFRLWNTWCNKQEDIERKELEKTFAYKGKKYLCKTCGERKKEEQFYELETKWVGGLRACVCVRNGLGICDDCHRVESERLALEYKEEMREYKRQWYQDHKAEISARQRERRHSNAEKDKAWKAAHKEQINQHIRERKQADPIYKLKCQARTTIYKSFTRTGNVKSERCEKLVGLSMDEFVTYLKETYEKTYGHPWDGIEPVHIDHIVPLATAQSEEDVMSLCHYTNLQLLTAQDNLAKGSKYAES